MARRLPGVTSHNVEELMRATPSLACASGHCAHRHRGNAHPWPGAHDLLHLSCSRLESSRVAVRSLGSKHFGWKNFCRAADASALSSPLSPAPRSLAALSEAELGKVSGFSASSASKLHQFLHADGR